MSARPGLRRELGLVPLMAVVFFNVSGGPYGIEDAVPAFGPGLVLVLLVLTPIVWSLPVALAMGELASALPEEGGYVAWVRRAFGPFWAFQTGWWSWLNSFVDVAVYPALFADYLAFWWPGLSGFGRWALALAFIWTLTALNVAGVRIVGWASVALGAGALLPVAVFTVVAAAQARHAPWVPFAAEGQSLIEGLGLGLAVMMWNYSGWDTPSTCLGEARAPEASFRRALFRSLPLIALAYVLPVGAALSATDDWARWETGQLPAVAAVVGGPFLAGLLTAGALVATSGLFLALLLTNSRLPYVLARDGQMPAALARVHPRLGTPWVAVVLSSVAYSICAVWSFEELIVLNIWLYSIALLVELAAFVALRRREPDLPRPWRVGGGAVGMWITAGLPAALCVTAMATAGGMNTAVGVAAALTGPLAYRLWQRRPPVTAR
ncbi:MAG: APC family permease [Candidatus Rokubacteria bacterium]|nr:APC family permease [Candidatus Rokubacteria bacterium]